MLRDFKEKLEQARRLSWEKHGKNLVAYLPGMFSYNGMSGKYPALSITGSDCALQCDHCQGKLLAPMINTSNPEKLIEKALILAEKGNQGVLISGGCDGDGRLPWEENIEGIKEIKNRTDLFVSIHSGLVDYPTANALKEAGVDQALIDVIGNDDTYRQIYHVPFGISRIVSSMEALERAGIPIVPHIVCGLHFGRIRGEMEAVRIISDFDVKQLVIVALLPITGTPLSRIKTPEPEEIAEVIVEARLSLPEVRLSLGCARKRGETELEILAIDAGINRMALPSEEALEHAKNLDLEVRFQKTCCSVSKDLSKETW